MLRDRERRMRTGSLRGAPLAGLGSAYHAVHVGPCSVIRVASAWRKKLPTRKCGSAYPNCAICSPRCYGAGGTALNTCCIGRSGEDDINSTPCAATIESADRLCLSSIYNCSTREFRESSNVLCSVRSSIASIDTESIGFSETELNHSLCRSISWSTKPSGGPYLDSKYE